MESNVVSIFSKKKAKQEQKRDTANLSDSQLLETFYSHAAEAEKAEREEGVKALEALAAKNKANDERVRKERLNANKGVLRSNRIDTKKK